MSDTKCIISRCLLHNEIDKNIYIPTRMNRSRDNILYMFVQLILQGNRSFNIMFE